MNDNCKPGHAGQESCHAQPESPPHTHQQREVDPEDHLRHEDGGGIEAAPRAGAGGGRASLRRTDGAHAARAGRLGGGHARPPGAAGRHRQGPDLPAGAGHRRSRPGRRIQLPTSAAPRARWRADWRPRARRSRSSPVGRKGRDYLRRELASRITGDISYAGKRRLEFSDAAGDRQPHHHHAGRRRDRRLHPDLQPIPLGDLADRHRAAADSRATAARRRSSRPGGASYEFEPDEETILAACCRRRWQSRSSARCWKARPASTALA